MGRWPLSGDAIGIAACPQQGKSEQAMAFAESEIEGFMRT
jgi:hypothetical protein